jgi:hypothetical protein
MYFVKLFLLPGYTFDKWGNAKVFLQIYHESRFAVIPFSQYKHIKKSDLKKSRFQEKRSVSNIKIQPQKL